MKAFISYSHQDENYLKRLHVHLAQLKRENLLNTWSDQAIKAGRVLDSEISQNLKDAQLFIALISPDYIASNYCYEVEFQKALEMNQDDYLIIVPIILEPCDWLSTPFKKFKALPKDGKALSEWNNINTAFLGISQELRKLLESNNDQVLDIKPTYNELRPSRNYKIQKDFDSIEKLEFFEEGFAKLKDILSGYVDEIINLDNIKGRVKTNIKENFECVLVNRNKVKTEASLKLSYNSGNTNRIFLGQNADHIIAWEIKDLNNQVSSGVFKLMNDEYNLFWKEEDYFNQSSGQRLEVRQMADVIWENWLKTVGIDL